MVAGEGAGFDAAQDQALIGEQLVPRFWKRGGQLVRRIHHDAHVLVFSRALQQHELQVLVVVDRAPDEFHFEVRLAVEEQDFLAPVLHVEQHLAHVVLRNLFAGLRRNAEADGACAGLVRSEMHAHGGRLAVVPERDVLRAEDASGIFHVQRNGIAGVPIRGDDDVHREVRAFQHRTRRVHTADLDVLVERFAADADGKDRHLRRAQPEQRFLDGRFLRVGAVGHHHEAGERQAGKFFLRAQQRLAELGLGAVVGEVARICDAAGGEGKAEKADRVARRQRSQHRAVRTEGTGHELASRLVVLIGHAHAARIVQQHAEKILLRHGRAQDEHRSEQAEQHHTDEAQAQRNQHRAIQQAGLARRRAVCQNGDKRRGRR